MAEISHTNCPQCLAPLDLHRRCSACGWAPKAEPEKPTGPREQYVGGLDLGQLQDHSALVLGKRTEEPGKEPRFDVVSLHRFELFTPYTQIVEKVSGWMKKSPWDKAPLAIDETGVGVAVVEMFEAAQIPGGIEPITITAGRAVTRKPGGGWHVAKVQLVSTLQALLSKHVLGIPAGLPLASVLTKELKEFKAKMTAAGNETFEADWRTRAHDDLCLALGLAAWLSERCSGEMNIHWMRLDQPPTPADPEVIKFPEIRYFAPMNSFQAMPAPGGELIACCPCFATQEEAAWFNRCVYQSLGLEPPACEIELDDNRRQAANKVADDFIRKNNLSKETLVR